jgi:hypothetical protein
MGQGANTWEMLAASARLCRGPLAGRVVFNDLGVNFLLDQWQGRALERAVLHTSGPTAKSFALQLSETYIRGGDLIATFARTPPHQIAPQIYWRAKEFPASSAIGVEMILSMQTDLLDSDPHATVTSAMAGAEYFYASSLSKASLTKLGNEDFECPGSAENLFLMRDARWGLSYSEMVHPSDFVSAEIFYDEKDHPCAVQSVLFPERLEKGVIRRARICGWFMPAENDLETAVELAKRFVDEPLPLTT